ncbi:MAG: polyprenyl synthetase family protein [Theionarchaea archaeon]|nr:polyprenyl synthetase family protein [Theionarchaea archaeon]
MNIPAVFHEYVELINDKILEVFESDDPAIRDMTLYHIQAGGKRARPILCMLTCQGLGGTLEDVFPYALTLEILHNVSLIYDDMIDGERIRRGKTPLHMKFGIKNALIVANYITWRGMEIFAEKWKPEALKELALAVQMISLGEKLDIDFSRISEDEYMRICENKTSYQFRVSSFLGALAATDDREILEQSKLFGKNLGVAFQIRDDVLNVVGKEKKFGKPIGSDFIEGRPNFVIVKAYEALGDSLFEGNTTERIKESRAVEEATRIAEEYLEKARAFLNFFTVEKYKEMLDVMIQFVVRRTF